MNTYSWDEQHIGAQGIAAIAVIIAGAAFHVTFLIGMGTGVLLALGLLTAYGDKSEKEKRDK